MAPKRWSVGRTILGRSVKSSVVVVVVAVSIVVVSILTIAGWMRMQHSVSGPPPSRLADDVVFLSGYRVGE